MIVYMVLLCVCHWPAFKCSVDAEKNNSFQFTADLFLLVHKLVTFNWILLKGEFGFELWLSKTNENQTMQDLYDKAWKLKDISTMRLIA